MKYICKQNYEVNGVPIARAGEVIAVVDAVPTGGETYEDVAGYCDITNLTTGQKFEATWLDIYGPDFHEPVTEEVR